MDRWTDGRIDRQADGRTDGETDRQTDGQTDRQTDGRTNGRTETDTLAQGAPGPLVSRPCRVVHRPSPGSLGHEP
eukprot:15461167-Alexandrium_andersonii.AAC.1